MISYRRPAVDEAPALAALHVQCWREAYTALVPAAVSARFDVDAEAPRWRAHLSTPQRFVLAAYNGAMPVGLVNEGAPDPLYDGLGGQVAALYVAQAFHRRGIARALLAAAAAHYLARGERSMGLGVLKANTQAQAFYAALGARQVREAVFHWHGHALPDITLQFDDLKALAQDAPALTPIA